MLVIVILIAVAIVALLAAGLIIGLAVKLLWWALIGLAIGALARLVLPGKQRIGLLETGLAGIAGSLLGGILAHAFSLNSFIQFLLAIALAAAGILFLESRKPARA